MSILKEMKLNNKVYIINGTILCFEKYNQPHYFLKNNNNELIKINKDDYLLLLQIEKNECFAFNSIELNKKIDFFSKNNYIIELNYKNDFTLERNIYYKSNKEFSENIYSVLLGNIKIDDKVFIFREDNKKKQYVYLFKHKFQEGLNKNELLTEEELQTAYNEFYYKNYLHHIINIEKDNLLFYIVNELIEKEKIHYKDVLLKSIYLIEEHYRNYLLVMKNEVYDEMFLNKLILRLIHETLIEGKKKKIFVTI